MWQGFSTILSHLEAILEVCWGPLVGSGPIAENHCTKFLHISFKHTNRSCIINNTGRLIKAILQVTMPSITENFCMIALQHEKIKSPNWLPYQGEKNTVCSAPLIPVHQCMKLTSTEANDLRNHCSQQQYLFRNAKEQPIYFSQVWRHRFRVQMLNQMPKANNKWHQYTLPFIPMPKSKIARQWFILY